jgi:hypothetical protein
MDSFNTYIARDGGKAYRFCSGTIFAFLQAKLQLLGNCSCVALPPISL